MLEIWYEHCPHCAHLLSMDIVDRDLEKAEREASPERFPEPSQQRQVKGTKDDQIERTNTTASSSGSSSSASSTSVSVVREEMAMARTATTRDLERHPTALSRIQTQRSQHNATVGSTKSRASQKPLPGFGAGKPYPPPLPEQEEYVVEFDGPDDPLHPQNWTTRRK